MVYEFKFPDVGEGITEGEIVKWRVEVGDVVKEDQVLADVETDKAVVEIPSPKSGVVLKLNARDGDTVNVGDVIALIGEKGEELDDGEKSLEEKVGLKENFGEKEKEGKKKSVSVVGFLEDADDVEREIKEARKEIKPVVEKIEVGGGAEREIGKVFAMPKVRKLAKELGVELKGVGGSGFGGRITERDVRGKKGGGSGEEVKKKIKVVRKYDLYGYVDRISLKGVRKTIAKRMVESATKIPHVTHMDKADVTHLFDIRKREKKFAEKKGVKLTFLPFIYKVVIEALKEHPYLNSVLDENSGEIILKKYYNVGFAIDTDAGLMVPVVKGADKKNILKIASEISDLAEKARERKISVGDLSGGTFTITNYGSVGGIFGTPIINYPESAILGIGRIKDEPVVVGGKVVVRKIMSLSLAFDHRILDGAEAARFMNKLISYLEDPDSLMLEL
tara:strand:+ start:749 stop:2092 length:1344 start_codon:yes stop_codon:yes gene_type:complete